MKKISKVAIALSIVSLAHCEEKVCRALVMSGGANKGAYTAGVIHGLSNILNGTDAEYDVVSGVSAGALNAAGVAMWPKEKPKEMADWLVNFWREVYQGMIF